MTVADETGARLLDLGCEAGFDVLSDGVVWMQEPGLEVAFLWVLARKPG